MGDSLIEFFDWQNRFPDRQVFNFGIAGETAEGLFSRLPDIIGRVRSPALVMIMTGINNVAMEDYGFLPTYEKIVALLQATWTGASLLMCSLLPVDLYFLGDAIPRVNGIMEDIAQNNKVLFLDLYSL